MSLPVLDDTHDPSVISWVPGANDFRTSFPPQNLPFGIFSETTGQDAVARPGVAIGDCVIDLREAARLGLLHGAAVLAALDATTTFLNPLMASGADVRRALRLQLFRLVTQERLAEAMRPALIPMSRIRMHLPFDVYGFTDFYAGIHHATNVGRLFRPDNPLLPNYKYVPIAYNSRASTVGVSGEEIVRPSGQIKVPDQPSPVYRPCRSLDYEVEFGAVIGTPTVRHQSIKPSAAWDHIFGFMLLNDWSARDIQSWEYQPLGPYLAKSFATTISPWVVSPEALAPFLTPVTKRPSGDPEPLPHLADAMDQAAGAIDVRLEAWLQTRKMRTEVTPHIRLSAGNARDLYWSFGQMLAHMTSNGCNLRTGDLIGSGTVSGKERSSWGSWIELSSGGSSPLELGNGETRSYLEDGDEVMIRGVCQREGFRSIAFGECKGQVMGAKEFSTSAKL
jgi:fumarylacetoacetase